MFSITAGKRASRDESGETDYPTAGLLSSKIWLPKFLYNTLPYFYLTAGFLALLATLYIGEWFWVLPHYLLFSIFCIHLGVLVRRHRNRARNT
jgi:hypothetical protein